MLAALRSRAACAAAMVLAAAALACPPAGALDYALGKDSRDRDVLMVFGSIEYGDEAEFSQVLNRHSQVKELWLSSGGGSVDASYKIGRMIRSQKRVARVPSISAALQALQRVTPTIETVRADDHFKSLAEYRSRNICASACGMLLAGGMARFVDESHSVGLHSATVMNSPDARETAATIAQDGGLTELVKQIERNNQQTGVEWSLFMQDMGIRPDYVSIASRVPQRCMYYLSSSEMDSLNVVNVQNYKTQGGGLQGNCQCAVGKSEAPTAEERYALKRALESLCHRDVNS